MYATSQNSIYFSPPHDIYSSYFSSQKNKITLVDKDFNWLQARKYKIILSAVVCLALIAA